MYTALKLIHILAMILFVGNLVLGLYWKRRADASGDRRIVAHTFAGIIRADRIFTMPSVIVIILSGFGAAGVAMIPALRVDWIVAALVLFLISGVVFMARVMPLQRRILALAEDEERFDIGTYGPLSEAWDRWAVVATLTPILAVALMVIKPDL